MDGFHEYLLPYVNQRIKIETKKNAYTGELLSIDENSISLHIFSPKTKTRKKITLSLDEIDAVFVNAHSKKVNH